MRLIVITTENFFDGEADAVNLLFENGLELLHIRKPYASQHETEDFIGQINENFHARIVIHDYYELINMFSLKGIHYNCRNYDITLHNDEPASHSRRLHNLSISRSCHSLNEVLESQFYDYVFLSPIFDSISKAGYKQRFTPKKLNEAKAEKIINEHVIALGGITAENMREAYSYGFGGVAVIGALWSDFAVNKNKNNLLERFFELKVG